MSAWMVRRQAGVRRNAPVPRSPIEHLALSFATLRAARGVAPWDPEAFDEWACGPEPSSGGFHAARFVLNVWNMNVEWGCGKFDLMRAMNAWDREHREAFLAWADDPWTA